MPLIQVKHASPLSEEQISSLIADLTRTYVANTNAAPGSVHVLVEQVPDSRWGVGGQTLRDRNNAATSRSETNAS